MKRFRAKRPDWFFRRGKVSSGAVRESSDPFIGAIGHFTNSAHQGALEAAGVPFYVGISNRTNTAWCARMISDDVAVGRMAAEYFLARGHRNFACLLDRWNHYADERAAGFCESLEAAGIRDTPRWESEDFEASLIDPNRMPLALLASNDSTALSVIGKLLAAGHRVPEDVAVLGVDDDDFINLISPVEISSIRLAADHIGFAACELLEQMMERKERKVGERRFAPLEVVERRSTGGRAVIEPRVRRAQAFIEAHLQRLGGVDEIAQGTGISRRSLERLFAEHLGMSPAEWVALRRADRAALLLCETDYTVEHVADLAGFEDRRRLYRAFRKLNRPLPKEIRRGSVSLKTP